MLPPFLLLQLLVLQVIAVAIDPSYTFPDNYIVKVDPKTNITVFMEKFTTNFANDTEVKVKYVYDILPGFAGSLSKNAYLNLTSDTQVVYIERDGEVTISSK